MRNYLIFRHEYKINIENYKKTGFTSYGGFVYRANANALFNNVHINNAEVVATSYLGGLIAYSNDTTTIKNCSVSNLVARTNPNTNIIGFRAGGLVGYINTGIIMNSYTYNIDFEFNNLLTSSGIGGIAGQTSNGYIEDVYATGQILSNANYVGGIAGYSKAMMKFKINKSIDENNYYFYVIDKMSEYKYLDDEAYAKAFILTYSNKYGKLKLKSMLRAKGVSQEIVDILLDDMEVKSSIDAVAEKYMKNKTLDEKTKSKLIRFLMSRGYDYDEVKSVVEKFKG